MKYFLLVWLAWFAPTALAVEWPAEGRVEALFTPWDDVEGALLREIAAARHDIHIQVFLFTSRNLARALIAAQRRGIQVHVLADGAMTLQSENSRIPELAAAGIEVRLETRYAAAHNKILLIDVEDKHPVVITGSYNFTFTAQARNAENLLILRDHPALARAFLANWRRHRDDAQPFDEAWRP